MYTLTNIHSHIIGNIYNAITFSTYLISSDRAWSSFISSLFIFVTGLILLYYLRGGGLTVKISILVLVSRIATDIGSKAILYTIGEVEHIFQHINTWRRVLGGSNSSVEYSVDRVTESLNKFKDFFDQIRESLSAGYPSSSFWGFDDITQIMSNYDAFLETLTLNQKYAMIHILLSFIIFLSISSIVMMYLGDELIKYFKLEEKFPKLARYIQLRRKFITYNIMFDSLIIFIALIVIVGFNLYNFTTL